MTEWFNLLNSILLFLFFNASLAFTPARIAQPVEHRALDHEAMGSNLPAVREVHWAVTVVVASPYQGVKLGLGLGPGNQSDSEYRLHASDREHR